MKVLKFGGTSVANAENISKVVNILTEQSKENKLVVVVSALGGVTNLLLIAGRLASVGDDYKTTFDTIENRHLKTIRSLIPIDKQSNVLGLVKKILNELENVLEGVFLLREFSNKTKDFILSFGERLSSYIVCEAVKKQVANTDLKDSRELIITDENFTYAQVKPSLTAKKVTEYFNDSKALITVLPGFVANTKNGVTTTLGRGGSDYTAAIYAGILNASVLEIWTDVSGMFTAHPKWVKQAFPIEKISYKEALELSHFGAKVLYPPTIQPVLEKQIPIMIKNTFAPEDIGTLIESQVPATDTQVRGISYIENIALVTLEGAGMVGIPGFSKKCFEALAEQKINVILITQASSEHSICIGINEVDITLAKKHIEGIFAYEILKKKIQPLKVEKGFAIIALVGDHMKNHQGTSGKMFEALGRNNVNVRAIAQGASENNISVVIAEKDTKKGLNALHGVFFEGHIKKLHLFFVGVGNVGGKLIAQIAQQQNYLEENLRIKIVVVGLANSKKMTFNPQGIDVTKWETILKEGEKFEPDTYQKQVISLNLQNSIFVDNTASEKISTVYEGYLKDSIPVVTCNKIAASSPFENYRKIKTTSRAYNAPFLYETNVGAGLPIIGTLANLISSGDRIRKIEAVLSGSLNYVFNNFDGATAFDTVVKKAMELGYTEPDPRIDLSGVDVARKILIMAREAGLQMELSDIENQSFLPVKSLALDTVPEFITYLEKNAKTFEKLLPKDESKQLKYVATLNEGKALVGLQEVSKAHPFYNLSGSDNIVLFYTDRYPENPLIIKGAGAGADVTASGLFADIIKIGNL